MTQKLFLGDACISEVKDLFLSKRWEKILLVTGKQSYVASGGKRFIKDCLSGSDAETIRFSEFDNNPNIVDLKKGLALTRSMGSSVIIAIGGGSVLDMAKLLRYFMTHDGEILGGQYTANGKDIPLVAIPTTAGTGAEATHFAVLYDDSGKKHSIADNSILPDYAVVYPPLTYGQSPYITACSGFDALAQAIEAYWNKNATAESDEYAVKAINLIYPSLPVAVKEPTSETRNKMAEGAYWAGKAINITKTTAPHAFSYPFTAHYGIPHGHAVSIVFPRIAEINVLKGTIPESKKQFLMNLFGNDENIYETIRTYIANLGLNIPSKEYDIEKILNGISIERLVNNPLEISKIKALSILNSI